VNTLSPQEEEEKQRAEQKKREEMAKNVQVVEGAAASTQAKRRKVGEGGSNDQEMADSDSDTGDEGGDLAADGDWEEFDAMPAQAVDVRGAYFACLAVLFNRASLLWGHTSSFACASDVA